MKGTNMKQTHFYMLSLEEEQRLIDYLRQDCDMKIVCYRTLTSELDIRDTPPMLAPNYHHYYLWDTSHSPPPINEYISTQDHYVIDFTHSEIIQFNRCSIRNEGGWGQIQDGDPWVNIGRIAINHKIWIGNELIERPKHFIALFEKARKWIKRNGIRSLPTPHDFVYVFPSAEKFFNEGGSVGPY